MFVHKTSNYCEMDLESCTWESLGVFETSEQAVEAKLKDEDSQRSQVIKEYYL
jgi:hypothetical protein